MKARIRVYCGKCDAELTQCIDLYLLITPDDMSEMHAKITKVILAHKKERPSDGNTGGLTYNIG